MIANKTEISIILATYNRAHLIEETLVSVQNQTFQDWECLIIDDGSLDDTAKIAERFIKVDKRFRYYKRGEAYKKGLPGSRNQGLDLAKGEFFIFFDDDDIVHPENLKICSEYLKNSNHSFCRYNNQPFFGEREIKDFHRVSNIKSHFFGLKDIHKMIIGKVPFASCSVMWNRRCFEKERFNEDLMYAEEWECYSRILLNGFEGISIDQVLYYNRKHSKSNTGEFKRNTPLRVASKLLAAKLVICNLGLRNLFNHNLEKFFIRLGFQLKSREVICLTLKHVNAGFFKKNTYLLGYKFYPFLRPFFVLKGNLKSG